MDVVDILGELLGRKTSKPSRGTDVLKDIFNRGSRKSSSSSTSTTSPSKSSSDISREAQELEELLNVAQDRHSQRRPQSSQTSSRPQTQGVPRQPSRTRRDADVGGTRRELDNERAVVLIRAMVNAAKADGKIDQAEQNKIIENLGGASEESISFLRKEFAAPLNVQEFVQSIPIGMEQQAYSMSLIAIDLDQEVEASYLKQLAAGLRIPVEIRKQIHQRFGAPNIY